jgi:hypothetical protein
MPRTAVVLVEATPFENDADVPEHLLEDTTAVRALG